MDIKNILSGKGLEAVKPTAKKSTQKASDVKFEAVLKDKLEISVQAKELYSQGTKDLEAIRERVNSNYYNSDEVIKKVAQAVLKEIQG